MGIAVRNDARATGRAELRAALIGTGLIATQKHLPAWQRMTPLASVVALSDIDPVRGGQVAARFDVPRVYSELGELVAAEKPDIVDICTPPGTHAALAIQAIEGGAHVLIEKPMALNTIECDAIIAAAANSGRQVCVAHSDLFYPSFATLRGFVQRGSIGEFKGMHISLSTPVDYITSKPDHWANKLDGGVIGETGPHVVYMSLAFINPIEAVHVHGTKLLGSYPWSRFEDYRLIFAGRDGVSSVDLSYATNQWHAEVAVWGTAGRVVADLESQSVIHADRSALTAGVVGRATMTAAAQMTGRMAAAGIKRLTGRLESTHGLLIRAFCRSIIDGTPPPVTAQEGREAIRVMDAIVEQLR